MSKTTEQLIQAFRNLIVGDLDVPKDDPDIDITDDEVIECLNTAQDELSRCAKLQAVNVGFTCTGGTMFKLDDATHWTNQRFDEIQSLYIGNAQQILTPLDDWNPSSASGVYLAGDDIIIMGTGTITGYACGNILAKTLAAGITCLLPSCLADFHLARYAVGMFAEGLSLDNQTQIMKIDRFKKSAETAARQYSQRQKQKRFPNTTSVMSYRV